MDEQDINQLADLYLTLWQENIRHWAAEKDLLSHRELEALLMAATQAGPTEATDV